jgi:type IV pilus assembly protein PilQ
MSLEGAETIIIIFFITVVLNASDIPARVIHLPDAIPPHAIDTEAPVPKDYLSEERREIADTNIIIPALDFSLMALPDALTALARAYKLSIFIDSSVTGIISLRLDSVSLNDALLFMMKEFDLDWERTGEIIKIFRPAVNLPPAPPLDLHFDGHRISLDIRDVELSRLVDTIIDATGRNFIIDDSSERTVTGRLVDIDLEKGLRALFRSNGLMFNTKDGIYHIGGMDKETGGGAKSNRYAVCCDEGMASLDVRQAPIEDVLLALSGECRTEMIIFGKIDGTITAQYRDRPVSDVLKYVLKGTSYGYKKEGETYLIGPKDAKGLFLSKLLRLNHVSSESIRELIPATLAENLSIKTAPEQNGLIVNGPEAAVSEMIDFINEVDTPPAQVLFEAIVVDYNLSNLKEFNLSADNTGLKRELPDHVYFPRIDYSGTGDNLNTHIDKIGDLLNITPIGRLSGDFFMRLRIMEEEGVANVRSRPQIAALNGHSASIKIGTSQYYLLESQTIYPSQQTNVSTQTSQRFEVIEADMSLEVIPWVTRAGEIIVKIKPEFNSPVSTFDPDVPPTINKRVLESTVRLRDGQTIVLGGMIQHHENATISKFPVLGNLPLIGRLFRNHKTAKTKSELMIYLTPHIYYGAEGSINIDEMSDGKD